MDRNDLSKIQQIIGFNFKNLDLLQQAFVRRSYSKENGGENNEVLEFIGDKVLDLVVVKILSEEFGSLASEWDDYNPNEDFDEFVSEYQENKLTEIKKRLVEKDTLANCIDDLGLAEYLIMGQGDRKNNIQESPSVMEDLFEAILGAEAIDSNYDIQRIQDSVVFMLNPKAIIYEDEINYVQEVQDWSLRRTGELPEREFKENYGYYTMSPGLLNPHTPNINEKHTCYVTVDGVKKAVGYGVTKVMAHEEASKAIYDYLEANNMLYTIRDEIDDPSLNMAINQLETLSRRGYFSLPEYEFKELHDNNGNPFWHVECHIDEMEYYFDADSSSKKQAKKEAAFEMLQYVLDNYEEVTKNDGSN